jgi:predicted DNA-binding mobile mystery protein A
VIVYKDEKYSWEQEVKDLLRRQLDEELSKIRKTFVERPPQGWIKSIREALGMTQAQLAKRLSVVPQVVQKIEVSEEAYTVQLATLKRVAEALDCRLSYVLLPKQSLQDIVDQQLTKKAKAIVERISHSMELEEQKTGSQELEAQVQRVSEELKNKKLSVIWEED